MADEIKIKVVVDDSQAVAGLKTTQKELAAVAATAVKADSKLLGLGTSLNKTQKAATSVTTGFKNLSQNAANVTSELGEVGEFANLAQLGIAGLSIIAIKGGIALYQYVSSLTESAKSQKAFNEETSRLNEVFNGAKSAYVKAVEDVSNLKIAFQQARDGVISKSEALKLYNESLGKSLGAVTSLDEAEKKIAEKGDAYIRFTLLKAAANAALNKSSEKLLQAEEKRAEERSFRKSREGQAFGGNNFKDELDRIDKERNAFENESNKFLDIQKEFQAQAEKLSKDFKIDYNGIKEGSVTVKKAAETISDVLAKLSRDIDFINKKELFTGKNFKTEKIQAIFATIEKLIRDFKVPADSTIIAKLFGDIQGTFNRFLERVPDLNIKVKSSTEIKEQIDKDYKEAQDLLGKNPLIIKAKISVGGSEIGQFEKLRDVIQQINKDTAKTVEGILNIGNVFTSIGESIGESLASGANLAETIFGNIFKILGAGLQELGKGMIAIATAKIVLEQFQFAPGIFTLLAGIAAVAAGGLLKTIKLPGFAGGVENFGGGLAIVGERGPELVNLPRGSDVIPNHRLGGISGGSQQIEVVGRLVASGNSLVAVIDGARRTNSRNGQG